MSPLNRESSIPEAVPLTPEHSPLMAPEQLAFPKCILISTWDHFKGPLDLSTQVARLKYINIDDG